MIPKSRYVFILIFIFLAKAWGNVVLIDPGHGGRDRGAEVPGAFEADVVWPWALSLKRELARLGIQADLTRNDKSSLSPSSKKNFFKDEKYHLIISLHANFFHDPKVKGVEYFVRNPLNLEDQKLKLAFEEQSEPMISTIIGDLESQGQLRQSLKMTRQLQKVWPGKIQQGNFEVLESSRVPAVLIELGYLSNAMDLSLLQNPKFIQNQSQRLAQAIKQSLIDVKVDVL
ncbi:MAG: N-acetylmuramoyl-L-alanine amidase [Bdellovibrionales bacterium]